MPETPIRDDRASDGAWIGCLALLLAGSFGISIGIVLMLIFT